VCVGAEDRHGFSIEKDTREGKGGFKLEADVLELKKALMPLITHGNIPRGGQCLSGLSPSAVRSLVLWNLQRDGVSGQGWRWELLIGGDVIEMCVCVYFKRHTNHLLFLLYTLQAFRPRVDE
jgi:hypothetical protein